MPSPTSTSGPEPKTPPSASTSGQSTPPPGSSSSTSGTPPSTETELNEREAAAARGLDDQLAAINALLGGPQAPEDPAAPDGPSDPADAAGDPLRGPDGKFRARTIHDLAEALDVEPEAIYDLTLTTGDGETLKLGDLKDGHQQRQQTLRETAKRERGLDERETALRAEQALWEPILTELRDKVPEEFKTRLRDRATASEARERARLLEAMPELKDRAAFDAFRQKTVEFLAGYGFTPRELTLSDHRMLVILRDHMRVKERLDQLLAYEPPKDPPSADRTNGRSAPGTRTRTLVNAARRSGQQADQLAAITGLINGR